MHAVDLFVCGLLWHVARADFTEVVSGAALGEDLEPGSERFVGESDKPLPRHRKARGRASQKVSLSDQSRGLLRRETRDDTERVTDLAKSEDTRSDEDRSGRAKANLTLSSGDMKLLNSMEADEDAVEQMRRMLGLTSKPCAALVSNMELENVSTEAAIRRCQQYGPTAAACEHALQSLEEDGRPWVASRISEVCSFFGEPQQLSLGISDGGSKPQQARQLVGLLLERSGDRREAEGSNAYTWHSALDTTAIPKARAVQPNAECASQHVALGVVSSVGACADLVKAWGGTYFSFGKGERAGECNQEQTLEVLCPEGFVETPAFDFYSVAVDAEIEGSCKRPMDWCNGIHSVYDVRDCDRDGIPDPFCLGPEPGVSGYLSSKNGCVDTFPWGGCHARQLKSGDSEECVTAKGSSVMVEECEGTLPSQLWYFAGPYLMATGQGKCLAVDAQDGHVMMASCREDDSVHWLHDASKRLQTKTDRTCMTRDPETGGVIMQMCNSAVSQRFYFAPSTDCKWSEWGLWGACSATCGDGSHTRYRFVVEQAEKGGLQCEGETREQRACQSAVPCPVHCRISNWVAWSECSESCGRGLKSRTRTVLDWPMFGGTPCVGLMKQQLVCNDIPCPDDCMWGAWGGWEACTKSCDGGSRTRSREIARQAVAGGRPCGCCAEETVSCGEQACPVDCRWSEWGVWTQCGMSCGGGVTERHRQIVHQSSGGGAACFGASRDTTPCLSTTCPFDCTWESWNDWTDCAVTCGVAKGRITRTRGRRREMHGGKPCDGLSRGVQYCSNQHCPIDCLWASWDEWSACFHGVRHSEFGCWKRRIRLLKAEAEFGGQVCTGDDFQTAKCVKCMEKMKAADGQAGHPSSMESGGVQSNSNASLLEARSVHRHHHQAHAREWCPVSSITTMVAILIGCALIAGAVQQYQRGRGGRGLQFGRNLNLGEASAAAENVESYRSKSKREVVEQQAQQGQLTDSESDGSCKKETKGRSPS